MGFFSDITDAIGITDPAPEDTSSAIETSVIDQP